MRHRVNGKKLSRDSEHRRAMLRNLAAGLFEHGQIETTLAKAKAAQPFVERLITIAKHGNFAARRELESRLTDRFVHGWVADPNVPARRKDNEYFDLPPASEIEKNRYGELRKAPRLIQHLMTNVAPRYADRDGGYTRIVRTGRHRLGDGTDLVVLQLVGEEEGPQIGGGYSRRREQADNRTAFAERLRKGSDSRAEAAAPVEEPVEKPTAEAEAPVATATEEPPAEDEK